MSDNLKRIIYLEDDLTEYLEKGIDTTNVDCENVVLEISDLLRRVSNEDLLYLLEHGTSIHEVINIPAYFKKYKINKKKLNLTKEYKEAFKKLNLFMQRLSDACVVEEEYGYICHLCDVDSVSNYLLENMCNEDIMELANETANWSFKLFLFEYLKA